LDIGRTPVNGPLGNGRRRFACEERQKLMVNDQWSIFNERTMNKNEVFAAIALALHEHLGNNVHDVEPGFITIQEHPTQWNGYALTMTAHP
jgi:hypothetical protein